MRESSSARRTVSQAEHDGDEVLPTLARVSRDKGLVPLEARLLELRDWLADDLSVLEQTIGDLDRDVASSTPGEPGAWGTLARRAARHLVGQPGKRIRPLCVLLAARLGGRKLDPVVRNLAVACELVHAATLLHDDVIDQGEERRGAPAARMLYGNSASILGGDHLLVEALRLVEATGQHTLLGELLSIIAEMVRAEAIQLEQREQFTPSRELYLDVIHGKTAALFRWGLRAGGTVAELPAAALDHLARAGEALGMAFQLIDDVLDLEGDPRDTGKSALTDLREGKLTWPVIIAAERDASLAAELRAHVLGAPAPQDIDRAAHIVERIRGCGALDATRTYAAQRAEAALEELSHVPEGRARQAIELVVQSAVHRNR